MSSHRLARAGAFKAILRTLAMCLAAAFLAAPAAASEEGCPTIAGIQKDCKKVFQPSDWKRGQTTYWIDTDGVDPGVAGCHIGVRGANDATRNGRFFGEACESNVILIESNPEAGKIHGHANDIGHPYRIDCNQWCIKARRARSGVCNSRVAAPRPCTASARCECK